MRGGVDLWVDNVTVPIPGLNATSFVDGIGRDDNLARIEIAVQGFILFLAIFGNTCVLIALRYRKSKTSRMHLFIFHLSIADLLVAFCNILPQLAWDITYRFQGNDLLCRLVKYLQIVVMYLSTYVLVMTAIDRYRAICYPLSNYSWSSRRVNIMITISWIMSLLLSLPQLAIFQMQEVYPGSGIKDCWVHFNPPWTVKAYVTYFMLTVYIIPFFLLSALYGRICWEVWKNVRRKRTGTSENHHHIDGKVVYKFNGTGTISIISPHLEISRDLAERRVMTPRTHSLRGFSRSKMKTIKLTFVVIIAYMICWSPFFITQMWWAFDETAPYNSTTFVICLLLASLNSCCNPWIYMAFSGSLIQQILPCCKTMARHPPRFRERVRSVPEVSSKSDSLSSDHLEGCHCQEKLMTEHRKHNHSSSSHCCLDMNLSQTSSTKVTCGTLSPTNSWKIRHNHACFHRQCRMDPVPNRDLVKSRGQVTSRRDEPFISRRDDLHYRSPYRRQQEQCTCRCLHEIKEDRLGEKGENVFYDLSSARRTRKTSSFPTLFSRSPVSYEKVETRCTTSV